MAENNQQRMIKCPQCTHVQPVQPICTACGFDIRAYVKEQRRKKSGAPPADPVSAPKGRFLPIKALFRNSFRLYRARLKPMLTVQAVMAAVIAIGSLGLPMAGAALSKAVPGYDYMIQPLAGLFGALLTLWATSVGSSAILVIASERDAEARYALGEGRQVAWSFIWLMLLVSLMLAGGYMLFIVPGLMFLVWFSLAPVVRVVESRRGMHAIVRSRDLVRGRAWGVALRIVLLWAAFALLSHIPYAGPVVTFLWGPYSLLVMFLMYRGLREEKLDIFPDEPEVPMGRRVRWFMLGASGFVLWIVIIGGAAALVISGAEPLRPVRTAILHAFSKTVVLEIPSKFASEKPLDRAGRLLNNWSGMQAFDKGCFEMGGFHPDARDNERPLHEVCLDDFLMDRHEVTQEEYQSITGVAPRTDKLCPRCPVANVSHDEAAAYCSAIGKALPTEAQWEYAARAGGLELVYCTEGGAPEGNAADVSLLDAQSPYDPWEGYWSDYDDGSALATPAGSYPPNPAGLYDMCGNVSEWTADAYGNYLKAAGALVNPKGLTGQYRVLRGGSFITGPAASTTTFRIGLPPEERALYIGFRCAMNKAHQLPLMVQALLAD